MSAIEAMAIARPAKPTARNQPGRDPPTEVGPAALGNAVPRTAVPALGRSTPFSANFPSPPPTCEASKGHHVNGFPGPKMPAGAYPPPRAVHHVRRGRGLRKIDAARAARRATSRLRPLRHDHAGARRHAGRREDPTHPPRHRARGTRSDRRVAADRSGAARAHARGDPAGPRRGDVSPVRSLLGLDRGVSGGRPRARRALDRRARRARTGGRDAGSHARLRLRSSRRVWRARRRGMPGRRPARRDASRRRICRCTSVCAKPSWRSRVASPAASRSSAVDGEPAAVFARTWQTVAGRFGLEAS